MSDPKTSDDSNSNNINTKWIIWIVFFIIIGITGIYFFNFHYSLSRDNAKWGTFGDYLGGILNPIVSAFALYLVARTYDLQKTELQKTQSTLNDQTKLAALTALLNTKLMHIDGVKSELIAHKAEKANIPKSARSDENSENLQRHTELDNYITGHIDKIKILKKEVEDLENKIKDIADLK